MIAAVDPGEKESGYVLLSDDLRVLQATTWPNAQLLKEIAAVRASLARASLAIELSRPFLMQRAGQKGAFFPSQLLHQAAWAGIFAASGELEDVSFYDRRAVKLQLLGRTNGGDAEIRQALIARYGGTRADAIGVKAKQGPLYGVTGDAWAALALAITHAEAPTRAWALPGLSEPATSHRALHWTE